LTGHSRERALNPKADLAAWQLREARAQLESNGLPNDQEAFSRAYSAAPRGQISDLFREFEG